MSPRARLLTEQRRRNLLDLIDQDGQVTVAEMVKQFAISAVTARSDLDALASIGAVVRSHGGAVRRLVATQDYPPADKRNSSPQRKGSHWAGRGGNGQAGRDNYSGFGHDNRGSSAPPEEAQSSVTDGHHQCVEYCRRTDGMPRDLTDHDRRSFATSVVFVCGATSRSNDERVHADRLFLAVDGFDLENGPSTPESARSAV